MNLFYIKGIAQGFRICNSLQSNIIYTIFDVKNIFFSFRFIQ